MTERTRWIGLVVFIVVCLGAGGLGAIATTPEIEGWYKTIAKPSWNPPDWIFGPVWTTLYVMMAVAAWLVWKPEGFKAAAKPLTLVRRSARPEHRLVVDLLRHAPARLGVRGDRDPVAGDRGDDGRVLSLLEDRRLADGAVSGLGQFRQRAELHDLADERGVRCQPFRERRVAKMPLVEWIVIRHSIWPLSRKPTP